ncbi:MAG: flagellar hook-length control protein FliK [Microthrixaceae bacterium]
MSINTVQPSQRPEPAAQPRRDRDDSFSGALQREMKSRGSDTRGSDAAQTRRRDAERDQAKREQVRKHGDESHGADANGAALQAASATRHEGRADQTDSAVDGDVGPGDGTDGLSVAVSAGAETSAGNTSEASDEQCLIGSAGSGGPGGAELVSGSTEGTPDGAAVGERATDVADAGSVDRTAGEEISAGSGSAADGITATGVTTAEASAEGAIAASALAGDTRPGSGTGPTAASQRHGVGPDSGTVDGALAGQVVADATGVAGAMADGDSGEAADSGTAGSAGSFGPDRTQGLPNAPVAGVPVETVETVDAPDAASNKSAAKVASATDMANVAHAAGSTASNQAAPAAANTAAPAVVSTAPTGGFDMSKLGEGIATRLRNGERVQSLSLELHPAELGAVRVDVRQIDGVTHLVLTPDRQAGGQRLAAAMADLRHDLERAGVDIGDLQLRQDPSGGGQDHRGGSSDRIVTNPRTGSTGSVIQPPITVRRTTQLAGSRQRVAIDL